jgi:hypothetical protein
LDPKPEGATEALAANEKLIPYWFNVTLGSLEAYRVYQSDREGVLAARWRATGPAGVTSVGVRDASTASVFVFDCDPDIDVNALLTSLLRLYPETRVASVSVRQSPSYKHGEIAFTGDGDPGESAIRGLRDYRISAILENRLYVMVTLGKRLIASNYPYELGIGLAIQRFPPLPKLAQTWTTEAVLSKLRQPGHIGPNDYELGLLLRAEHRMLIHELVRRRASNDDLFAAGFGDGVSGGFAGEAVLRELETSSNIPARLPLLKRVLEVCRQASGNCVSYDCSFLIFPIARRAALPMEAEALEYAKTARQPWYAISYLGGVSSSRETLEALSAISVPASYLQVKEAAIRAIRARIENPTRQRTTSAGRP